MRQLEQVSLLEYFDYHQLVTLQVICVNSLNYYGNIIKGSSPANRKLSLFWKQHIKDTAEIYCTVRGYRPHTNQKYIECQSQAKG